MASTPRDGKADDGEVMKKKLKIDRVKLKRAVDGMEAKARELGWSRTSSAEEVKKAIDEPKFVYVKLEEIWGPWKRGKSGNQGGFAVTWGAEKIGFGEITFCIKDGKVICDTECMSKGFVRSVMLHLLETGILWDPKK